MLENIATIAMVIFPLCMVFAVFYDLFTMKIPNAISLALTVSFAICAPLAGMGWETALWHIGIAIVVLIVGFGLFSFGVMGGGDAKLLAASALWFGTAATLPYILVASILGGLLTVLFIIARRIPLPPALASKAWVERLYERSRGVPYGVALGPAALYVFLGTPWMGFLANGHAIG